MIAIEEKISARDLLDRYSSASVLQMAREHGIENQGKGKDRALSQLAKIIYEPRTIAAALADLEPLERTVLDRLILMGGRGATATLRRDLEAEGKIEPREVNKWGSYQPERGALRRGSRKLADIITRLGAAGLVFSRDTSTGKLDLAALPSYLFIPGPILEHLPPVSLPVETAPTPREEAAAEPSTFLRDIYTLLTVARDRPIPLTTRGQIIKRSLVQIDQLLRVREGAAEVRSESDLGRLPLLRAVAESLGLLEESGAGLQLTDKVQAFLERPSGERRRELFQAYRKTGGWSELLRLNVGVSGNLFGAPVVQARQRVLAELAELPGEEWLSLPGFIGRMRRRAYEFLLPRDWGYSRYYYSSSYEHVHNPYYGDNAMGFSVKEGADEATGWDLVEGGFIRAVVIEALHWLGLVDVGFTAGEPSAFRLTREGALLLHGGTPPSPPSQSHVVIQPNFQLFAFEPTAEDVLFQLDRLAERVRAEQVVEYHLTRQSIYSAQRSGMEIDDILGFLEGISSTPLPQNVRRSLEEWGAQHERIVVRAGVSALQAIDEATLDALYADPAVRQLLGRRLGPTVALVPLRNLAKLNERLVGHGSYPMPALSEGNDAYPNPALTVDEEGRVAFQQPLPSVYVTGALRPFADEEQGTMRLTVGSLRRAAKAGMTAEDMIATLERFHAGELPAEVAAMVRRWAKDWGQGALGEVTLLRVQSEEILNDLLAEPGLRPYLQRLPGAATVAVVRDRVEHVRSLLEARGMDLSGSLTGR